eukprot:1201909-Ditylum_brightwellii.AAC.1
MSWDDVNVFYKAYSYVGFGSRNSVKYAGFKQFLGLIKNEEYWPMLSLVTGPGTLRNVQYY